MSIRLYVLCFRLYVQSCHFGFSYCHTVFFILSFGGRLKVLFCHFVFTLSDFILILRFFFLLALSNFVFTLSHFVLSLRSVISFFMFSHFMFLLCMYMYVSSYLSAVWMSRNVQLELCKELSLCLSICTSWSNFYEDYMYMHYYMCVSNVIFLWHF